MIKNEDERLCYYCHEFPVREDLLTFCDENCKAKWQEECAPKSLTEKKKSKLDQFIKTPEERQKIKERFAELDRAKILDEFNKPITDIQNTGVDNGVEIV